MNGDNSSKRVFEKPYKLCLFPKTRTVKYLKNHFSLNLLNKDLELLTVTVVYGSF